MEIRKDFITISILLLILKLTFVYLIRPNYNTVQKYLELD